MLSKAARARRGDVPEPQSRKEASGRRVEAESPAPSALPPRPPAEADCHPQPPSLQATDRIRDPQQRPACPGPAAAFTCSLAANDARSSSPGESRVDAADAAATATTNSLPPAPSGNPGNRVHHPLPPPVRPQTRSCACALARLTRPEPRPSPVRQRQRRRRNAWRLEPMRKRRRRAELSGWGRGPGFLLAAGWLVPRPRSFRALRGGLRHTLGRACSV